MCPLGIYSVCIIVCVYWMSQCVGAGQMDCPCMCACLCAVPHNYTPLSHVISSLCFTTTINISDNISDPSFESLTIINLVFPCCFHLLLFKKLSSLNDTDTLNPVGASDDHCIRDWCILLKAGLVGLVSLSQCMLVSLHHDQDCSLDYQVAVLTFKNPVNDVWY